MRTHAHLAHDELPAGQPFPVEARAGAADHVGEGRGAVRVFGRPVRYVHRARMVDCPSQCGRYQSRKHGPADRPKPTITPPRLLGPLEDELEQPVLQRVRELDGRRHGLRDERQLLAWVRQRRIALLLPHAVFARLGAPVRAFPHLWAALEAEADAPDDGWVGGASSVAGTDTSRTAEPSERTHRAQGNALSHLTRPSRQPMQVLLCFLADLPAAP